MKYRWELNAEPMNCCGALEVVCFPECRDDDMWHERNDLRVDPDDEWNEDVRYPSIKNQVVAVEDALELVINTERKDRPYSHHVVTFLEWQKKTFGAMIRRHGFKLVGDAINGNTGNRVWMYVRMRPETKAPVKKRKMVNGEWRY